MATLLGRFLVSPTKRSCLHLIVAVLFMSLFMPQASAFGQRKRIQRKPHKPMITLTSPVSGIKITFDTPAFIENPLRESAWKHLIIRTPNDMFTVEAPDGEAYMINSEDEDIWSPDGKYMSLYRVYGIESKEVFTGMTITFMALEYGEVVEFFNKKRLAITTDNFQGWVKTKPHTALKRTGVTGKFDEAEPSF